MIQKLKTIEEKDNPKKYRGLKNAIKNCSKKIRGLQEQKEIKKYGKTLREIRQEIQKKR